MKTNILTLAAALFLAGVGFVACDDSEEIYVAGTPPVAASEEVTAFFKTHLPESSSSYFETGFNFGELDHGGKKCILINSIEEFAAIAPPSAELPAVDFGNYTLVIGLHQLGAPAYKLERQAVDTESDPDKMTLNLVYSSMEGAAPAVVTIFYVWGLYPKLPQRAIDMKVTII